MSVFRQETTDATWIYNIKGQTLGQCQIDVKLLYIKTGTKDKEILEGKEMSCFLELGSIADPISDLKNCHGLLKEEIQEIIIRNAHAQILSNIGEIGEELKSFL